MKTNLIQTCLLAVALLALPAMAQAQFNYTSNNGTITITGYTGSGGAVTIPATLNGLPVTSIGDGAFTEDSVTSVTISDSVTTIGHQAFLECYNLTNVVIPDSVTNIGDDAFELCYGLTMIAVDTNNSVYSSLNGVLFDKSQTTLVLFPEGKSGNYTIADSVTSIGERAFDQCPYLTNVTIGSSITNIGRGAFASCWSLVSVAIGNSVTSIGDSAFAECSSLTSITIPYSVTNIGYYAFGYCISLTVITLDTNNPVYSSVDGVLFDKGQATLIQYPLAKAGSYTIPNSVAIVGDDAFAYCSGLTNLTIPDSVISIGNWAFDGCAKLTSVTIGNGVTSIGNEAFAVSGLTSVAIPDNVTSIECKAFAECHSLTSVNIDARSIVENAFEDDNLTNITIGSSVTNIECLAYFPNLTVINVDPANMFFSSVAGVLFDKNQTTLIQYPPDKADNSYNIPDIVLNIGENAFYGCYNFLTDVTIGNSVTSIGDAAFADCYLLTTVTIPNSVTSIGDAAFSECGSLTNVTIGSSVTSIGDWAFELCYSLANVMIPNSVTSIGNQTFGVCGLTSITIPDSVTNIGDHAFGECNSLTNVIIGNGVTSIRDGAFEDCASLTSITIGKGVTSIGDGAFYDCTSLTNIYFKGNAPALVGNYVFDGHATAYYLPGTTGWADFSATTGVPAVVWRPLIQTRDAGFGVRTNQFGFNISWASGRIVVVEASTNLSDWTPIATKTLTGDTFYFNDLEWANYSSRFYQLLDFLAPPPGSGGYTGFDFYLDICRSPNSDFNSKIEAFHMIVTFVISNEIRDPISLSSASEATYIARSLDSNDPDLNILTAYIGGVRGP